MSVYDKVRRRIFVLSYDEIESSVRDANDDDFVIIVDYIADCYWDLLPDDANEEVIDNELLKLVVDDTLPDALSFLFEVTDNDYY